MRFASSFGENTLPCVSTEKPAPIPGKQSPKTKKQCKAKVGRSSKEIPAFMYREITLYMLPKTVSVFPISFHCNMCLEDYRLKRRRKKGSEERKKCRLGWTVWPQAGCQIKHQPCRDHNCAVVPLGTAACLQSSNGYLLAISRLIILGGRHFITFFRRFCPPSPSPVEYPVSTPPSSSGNPSP